MKISFFAWISLTAVAFLQLSLPERFPGPWTLPPRTAAVSGHSARSGDRVLSAGAPLLPFPVYREVPSRVNVLVLVMQSRASAKRKKEAVHDGGGPHIY